MAYTNTVTMMARLMARYCNGDAEAFRMLYAVLTPHVVAHLTPLARGSTSVMDVLQRTFLKVHRARAAYIQGADPLPWVIAMADLALAET